jgi:hypothetical protein
LPSSLFFFPLREVRERYFLDAQDSHYQAGPERPALVTRCQIFGASLGDRLNAR